MAGNNMTFVQINEDEIIALVSLLSMARQNMPDHPTARALDSFLVKVTRAQADLITEQLNEREGKYGQAD